MANGTEPQKRMSKSDTPEGTYSLPILCVKGSHYQVGYEIGSIFKDRIHRYWNNSKDVLLSFFDTSDGRQQYDKYLEVSKCCFPQYIREIEGISDGSKMPFVNLFLLHLEIEIFCSSGNGCSIVLLNGKNLKLLGHNEDNFALMKETAFLVQADVFDEEFKTKGRLTAYTYPGRIPGYSFSFNQHGMCIAINTLLPKINCHEGCPQALICRALCSVKDIDDCIVVLRNTGYGCNTGFCVNVASTETPKSMWSIEVAPGQKESKLHVTTIAEGDEVPNYYFHVNNYRHMDMLDKVGSIMIQNMERLKRLTEMDRPTSFNDIKAVLGDQKNPQGCIYRTDKNSAQTVASAIFDILDKKCYVFLKNPVDVTSPEITLLM